MSLNHPNCPECGYAMDRVLPGTYECYSCKGVEEVGSKVIVNTPKYFEAQKELNKRASLITEKIALKSLGSSKTEYQYDTADPKLLEKFKTPFEIQGSQGSPNQVFTKTNIVSLDCFEFSSLCPITGQPDWGKIEIEYNPDKWCVESKSLKLYLMSYRQHGAFHESCVNKIACDLFELLNPFSIRVKGNFNGRGGISINPVCIIHKED
jgi:7-cyano-7-deazaguanine reductase